MTQRQIEILDELTSLNKEADEINEWLDEYKKKEDHTEEENFLLIRKTERMMQIAERAESLFGEGSLYYVPSECNN